MRDIEGTEIGVGDRVVLAAPQGRDGYQLKVGKVTHVSACFATVEIERPGRYESLTRKCTAGKILVLSGGRTP